MTALLDPPAVVGVQDPRILWTPPGQVSTLGPHAAQWARDTLGIELDPWQCRALDLMLAKRADDKWVAFECALILSRRSGKSLVFMVRELYGLFVLQERRIVHSAHEGGSAMEAYGETIDVLENARALDGLISKTPATNGKEGVETYAGCKLRFKTRTRTGGRGLGGNLVVLDEAQELQEEQIRALAPILAAQSVSGNPQLLYGASAGTYVSAVLGRVRRRGIAGGDPRLLFMEHSIDEDAWGDADPDQRMAIASDPAQWALANPALGIRISEEYLAGELVTLGAIGFAQEHLGLGSYPVDDSTDWLIPRAKWAVRADPDSAPPVGAVALAVGAAWDRTVSMGVCGARSDGVVLAELTHYGAGPVVSIVAEVLRLRDAHRPAAIVVDPGGPADFLIAPLEAAGVVLEKLSVRDVAAACSGLHAAVIEAESVFTHRGQPEVAAALAGARKKDVGDGWVLDRRRSSADVTPLEVLALARWGFVKYGAVGTSVYETRGVLVLD